jgi:hypothetical protein
VHACVCACVRLHWRRVLKRCERGAEGECKMVAWQVGEEVSSFEEWNGVERKSGLWHCDCAHWKWWVWVCGIIDSDSDVIGVF